MRHLWLIAVLLVLGHFGLGYMHEQVHKEIFRGYGIESRVEYISHFPDFVTIAESPCPTDSCKLAHNINEIVGYPLGIIYLVFAILIFYRIIQEEIKLDILMEQ